MDAAAAKVEQVLAGFVPLALGFVADFLGLGGLPDAVRAQLTQVRKVVEAVSVRLFDPAQGFKALPERAANRAKKGYAINLSAVRHEAGRTYGLVGTASLAKTRMEAIVARNISLQRKRDAVVEVLKEELKADVKAMQAVVAPGNLTNPAVWGDIDGGWQPKTPKNRPAAVTLEKDFQNKDVGEPARTQLKQQIAARILQGEQELLNQPMDVMKTS